MDADTWRDWLVAVEDAAGVGLQATNGVDAQERRGRRDPRNLAGAWPVVEEGDR